MKARLLDGFGWLLFVTGVLLSAGMSLLLSAAIPAVHPSNSVFEGMSSFSKSLIFATMFGGMTYLLSLRLRGHPWRWSLAAISAPVLMSAILSFL